MKVHVFKNEDAASLAAAMLVCAQILTQPDSVLAVENSLDLQSTYEKLLAFYKAGSLAVHNAKLCLTNEYCNLSNEQNNYGQMQAKFLQAINLAKSNFYNFNLELPDRAQAALEYEQTINNLGGIDMALLTISEKGDVLFNQAGTSLLNDCHFSNLVHEVNNLGNDPLKESTQVNIPVLTMGMGTIMRAKTILIVAYGRTKAASVANLVRAHISTSCPATMLQLHKNVILLLDEAAASLI